jgi:hypothetical protein
VPCVVNNHVIKTYGEVELKLNTFLFSALDGVSRQRRAPADLGPGNEPPIGQEAGWGPRLVRKLWR